MAGSVSTAPPGVGGARLLLLLAAVLAVSHAFVPHEKFIHRGDDAFYYFEVAANYADAGHWTFDRISRTNGVQPLWAMLLGGFALVLDAVGIEDRETLSRVFVALAAAANVASAFVLHHLLQRTVSPGTALAAAGAFLVPMGLVWQRVWGMENSLYALLLVSTVAFYHLRFRAAPTVAAAIGVGCLLAATVLARLNAGFLVPFLLLHLLLSRDLAGFGRRLWLAFVVGAAASLPIVAYLGWNWIATEHLLPVSAAAKAVHDARRILAGTFVSPLSPGFWQDENWQHLRHLTWFVTSRMLDGMWLIGSRVLFFGNSAAPVEVFAGVLAAILALPAVVTRRPGEWLRFLTGRLGRLAPFWYVLAFGICDAVVSILQYPNQLGYAMIRWWWVENEIILIVVAATLATAAVAFVARGMDETRARVLVPAAFLAFLAFQAAVHVDHYWDKDRTVYDWNRSGNDAWYDAAQWLNANVPSSTIVGAWNAGVLGYYSDHRVVNLDGLINGFDYLPYLRDGRIEAYIRNVGIRYLADMETMYEAYGLPNEIPSEDVYRKRSRTYRRDLVIYRLAY